MLHRVMRVLTFTVAAIVGVVGVAAAQGVGVKGGLVFPSFSSDALQLEGKIGWQAGLFVGGNRDAPAGVQAEFNYLRKRVETSSGDVTLSYIQVPVMLRLQSPSSSPSGAQIYGLLGPSFDVKLGEDFDGLNFDDGFEGLDVGVLVGAGVEAGRLIFEGRYSRGLRQINKNFQSAAELKGHSFALLAGIRFN